MYINHQPVYQRIIMSPTTQNITSNTSANDVVTVTSNGTLVQYKSDEYVNKVFRYFVLELVRENDSHNLLTDEEMFNLININANINEENITEQPNCIQNLYEDVMKLKNNYLFAYYLSRLSEYRNSSNDDYSSVKYFKYSEYITALNKDIETINWDVSVETIRDTQYLQGIYGDKMHSLTNEFIRNGYVSEVTARESIDDVIQLYLTNIQTMLCNIKISKLTQIKEEFDNLTTFNLNDNCENCDCCGDDNVCFDDEDYVSDDDEDYVTGDDSDDDDDHDDEDDDEEDDEDDDEEDEIYEWYYGNDENKKRKFEELVLSIINKYEINKKIKIEDKRIEEEYKRDTFFDKIIAGVLRFTVTYCIVSYLMMNFKYFSGYNSNNLTLNNCTNFVELPNDAMVSDNVSTVYEYMKLGGTNYEFLA